MEKTSYKFSTTCVLDFFKNPFVLRLFKKMKNHFNSNISNEHTCAAINYHEAQ
jgi:hypothetical protein